MICATIVGARPQFIKAALLSEELDARGFRECLIHTGQHYDFNMSDIFFKQLCIRKPDYSLNVGSGSHAMQTGEMIKKLGDVLEEVSPDWVIVFGDTNSTLAGALTAAKLCQRLAHVESGLRSFDRAMPEEINRVVTDHLADVHFVPNQRAAIQLKSEGIDRHTVVAGDLMVDLLHRVRGHTTGSQLAASLGLQEGRYALATVHRASNTDDTERLQDILTGLSRLDIPVAFPVHPRTAHAIATHKINVPPQIRTIPPVSFSEMVALQASARVILTDSGGVQKEAYSLGVPCVTLREETEWTETLEDGWNMLAGHDPALIVKYGQRMKPSTATRPLFGDGASARRIADTLVELMPPQTPKRNVAQNNAVAIKA